MLCVLFTQLLLCDSPIQELAIYFWDSSFKMFSKEENKGKEKKNTPKFLCQEFLKDTSQL
jgi:hypothetical protein